MGSRYRICCYNERDNQGLYNPYMEDSYNGLGPSGTLWSSGPTSESNGMNYMEWVDAIGGNANSLPGQTLSMWCLEKIYILISLLKIGLQAIMVVDLVIGDNLLHLLQGLLASCFRYNGKR